MSPGDVLANSIEALGFGIAFYYGMTGFACVFYYRKHLFKSFKNFIFIGLAPFLGAAILTVLFVIAIFYYSDPVNSASGTQAWLPFIHFNFTFLHQHFYVKKGLGPPLVLGIGLLLIGMPLMLIWKINHPEFFQRDRETAETGRLARPRRSPPASTPVTRLMAGDIILGYDGSDGSKAALAVAVSVAQAFDAPLSIVFGYEPNPMGGETADYKDKLEKIGEDMVAGALAAAKKHRPRACTPRCWWCPCARSSPSWRRPSSAQARVIVVGGSGERPIVGAILGSVPHKLLHRSDGARPRRPRRRRVRPRP